MPFSRLVDDSNSEYMQRGDAIGVTTYPISMGGWVNFDALPSTQVLFAISDASASGVYHEILALTGPNRIAAGSDDGPNSAFIIQASPTITLDTWHYVLFVLRGATNRDLYWDGSTKNSNTTNTVNWPAGLDTTTLGAVARNSTTDLFVSGLLSNWTVWTVALDDDHSTELYNGVNPYTIYPESIQAHWPVGIGSPEPDWSGGGYELTLYNAPVVGAHGPRVEPFGVREMHDMLIVKNEDSFPGWKRKLMKHYLRR